MHSMQIKHNPRGYYTMYVDGKFFGNYDRIGEAITDYENEFGGSNV